MTKYVVVVEVDPNRKRRCLTASLSATATTLKPVCVHVVVAVVTHEGVGPAVYRV